MEDRRAEVQPIPDHMCQTAVLVRYAEMYACQHGDNERPRSVDWNGNDLAAVRAHLVARPRGIHVQVLYLRAESWRSRFEGST